MKRNMLFLIAGMLLGVLTVAGYFCFLRQPVKIGLSEEKNNVKQEAHVSVSAELEDFINQYYTALVSGDFSKAEKMVTGQAYLNLNANKNIRVSKLTLKDIIVDPVLVADKMAIVDVEIITQDLKTFQNDVSNQRLYITAEGEIFKVYDVEPIKTFPVGIKAEQRKDMPQEVSQTVKDYFDRVRTGSFGQAGAFLAGIIKEKALTEEGIKRNYSLDFSIADLELKPVSVFDGLAVVEADYLVETDLGTRIMTENRVHFFLKNVLGQWKIWDIKLVKRKHLGGD